MKSEEVARFLLNCGEAIFDCRKAPYPASDFDPECFSVRENTKETANGGGQGGDVGQGGHSCSA